MLQAGEAAIEKAQQLIRSASWEEMAPAAEAAVNAAANEEQKSLAESLFQLADLASFYQGGIQRAIMNLEVGNTFMLTELLQVVIVETGSDFITIRYEAKNKRFPLSELPLVLAHKLAEFQVEVGQPTGRAAKAAYQAVTPKATPEHRTESIEWLESIGEEIEGADAESLIQAIEATFGNNP